MKAATKSFRFHQFTVTLPVSVVALWSKMPLDTVGEIWGSVNAADWRELAAEKRAYHKPVSEAIRIELEREIRISKSDSPMKTWEILTDRRAKEQVLWLLRFQKFRNWKDSTIDSLFGRAVAFAAMDGDEKFFKRLGRILEEKAIPFKPPAKPTGLSEFLRTHWFSEKGLCLCWFSDKALTQLLECVGERHTEDAVRKARERLGLQKLRKPLVRAVRRNGNRVVCE